MEEHHSSVIRGMVRDRYARVARETCGCGPSSSCCGGSQDRSEEISRLMGYSKEELEGVVKGANLGLGCGNPTAISHLKPGDIVLDLGSGGGFDCFLAARMVGEKGRVIGVDMTLEMLNKARENAAKMKTGNVEFRLGEIEHLPVADNSVDVIISNCVINLSPEKEKVFKDAYRVLKPGGRLAVSDMVATAQIPEAVRKQAANLTGCIAGALHVDQLKKLLHDSGFTQISIALKDYSKTLVNQWRPEGGVERYVSSADIQAFKPLTA